MLTYGCGNVTQDEAAVSGGGGGGFGSPASETNKAQLPNTNNDGANAIRTLLLRRVVNAEPTRIGGPASGGLAPVNPGFTMATAVLQATGQGTIGAVTFIIALTDNTDTPTKIHRAYQCRQNH